MFLLIEISVFFILKLFYVADRGCPGKTKYVVGYGNLDNILILLGIKFQCKRIQIKYKIKLKTSRKGI